MAKRPTALLERAKAQRVDPLVFAKARQPAEIPADTCPIIDGVKSRLEGMEYELALINSTFKEGHAPKELGETIAKLEGLYTSLESIRAANAQLRAIGKYWYDISKELIEGSKKDG